MRNNQLVRVLTLARILKDAAFGLTISQLHEQVKESCGTAQLSERTIRRDLIALRRAGFHISSERHDGRTLWLMDLTRSHDPVPLTTRGRRDPLCVHIVPGESGPQGGGAQRFALLYADQLLHLVVLNSSGAGPRPERVCRLTGVQNHKVPMLRFEVDPGFDLHRLASVLSSTPHVVVLPGRLPTRQSSFSSPGPARAASMAESLDGHQQPGKAARRATIGQAAH